jgi:quinoprotein glucose dehydrogenase
MTSPPAVIDDVVVIGSAIDDNSRVDMPSGVVRSVAPKPAPKEIGSIG